MLLAGRLTASVQVSSTQLSLLQLRHALYWLLLNCGPLADPFTIGGNGRFAQSARPVVESIDGASQANKTVAVPDAQSTAPPHSRALLPRATR